MQPVPAPDVDTDGLFAQPSWLVFADCLLARAALLARVRDVQPPDGIAGGLGEADEVVALVADLTGQLDAERTTSASVAAFADELVRRGETAYGECVDRNQPLGAVAATAALNGNEVAVLALLIAVELDPRRQRLAGYLNDDLAQRWLTPYSLRLILEDDDAVMAVAPGSGLRRGCLVEIGTDRPLGAAALRPAAALTWWLAGDESLDPALPSDVEQLPVDGAGIARLAVVSGPDRIRRLQAVTANMTGQGFLVCSAEMSVAELDAVVRRASLSGETIVVETDAELPAAVRARIERAFHLGWAVSSAHDLAIETLPRRPWTQLTVAQAGATHEEAAAVFGADVGLGAALTAAQLDAAATAHAALAGTAEQAIRRIAAGHIEQLATRIVPTRDWDDLVLEGYRLRLVRAVADRARHRDVVYDEWGFSPLPSTGVTALFAGPSGTGKTLAAEIVAGSLGLDLYRIDLSQLVSKYVGETEKNLSNVFAAAEASPVVLFFDEADAILGKRSEVSDAHDRYANIEVAYLLQRLERYNGVVVLATNLANNIDPAFLRRVHVAVEFPMPEAAERLRIWQRSIPPSAPTEDLDLAFLADRFELSGGSIANAAATGAFVAAAAGGVLTMPALCVGVKRELQKLARLVREDAFGRWTADIAALE